MAKEFDSISSLMSYVNSCGYDAMKEIGEKGVEVMRDVTQSQVDGETGDMLRCIDVTRISKDELEIKWQDNGGWHSVINGNHMYAPIAHEMGKVWGKGHSYRNPVYKPKTSLEETSSRIMESEAPQVYKKVMKSKGFDVT